MILCDIGNTHYHFFMNNRVEKMPISAVPKILNEKQGKNKKIIYISVNDVAEEKLIKNNNCINLEPFIDLNSKYDPSNLGADRKVACYGATDAVIIDAGSAITVDVVSNRKHLGGFILPGLHTMINNIHSASDTLKDLELNLAVNLNKLPTNTVDAISFGIIKPIYSVIRSVAHQGNIIFTGGDGKFLSKLFDNSTYNERLIFINMLKIIENSNINEMELSE